MTTADQFARIETWMHDHERHDDARFEKGAERMDLLVTKNDLRDFALLFVEIDPETREPIVNPDTGQMVPKFAMKKDVAPVIEFYQKSVIAAELVNKGGKWVSRTVLGLAALLIALGVITGGFKTFLAALVSWAMPK